jgi:hypothetical protein
VPEQATGNNSLLLRATFYGALSEHISEILGKEQGCPVMCLLCQW